MQFVTVSPTERFGEFFAAAEFFPADMFRGPLPAAEVAIARVWVAEVLDPLRRLLCRPIEINGARQQAGWRFEKVNAPGAAGDASDHMVLARNPLAVGAADLVPGKIETSVTDIFVAVWLLVRTGAIPPPRECLLERRRCPENPARNAEWVHLTPREDIKSHPDVAPVIDDPRAKHGRSSRTLANGAPHRFWRITLTVSKTMVLLGSRREAVRPEAMPV